MQAVGVSADDVTVLLGKHFLDVTDELGSKNSSVREIILHPDWNVDNDNFDSDLAIVLLSKKIEFTRLIRPVCLPVKSFNEVTGKGFVAGWGQSQRFQRHDIVPNQLHLPAVNASHCFSTFPDLAEIAANSAFCAGIENQGIAPCQGDSGGGFFMKNTSTEQWYVQGIVSGSLLDSDRQCNINAFQLYTNVARVVDWIEKVIANNSINTQI
jgi:transmembrane protease serine 9